MKDNILGDRDNINLIDSTPLGFMHIFAISIFFVKFSWFAVGVAVFLYFLRVFALTGGYHRYFAHNSYKTGRAFQFTLAFVGGMSAQLGALWWAAHHRHHHQYSDKEEDIHSPYRKGFFYAHIGWLLCHKYYYTDLKRIPDFAKYPELRFLDKYHVVPVVFLALCLYFGGEFLAVHAPALKTSGLQLLAWGFFFSSVFVYHATFAINSLTHLFGNRRFNTTDQSRNSLILALITLGEGWHNNHHRYPVCTRQGIYWWEIDITFYVLKLLSWMGVVWDIRPPSQKLYVEAVEVPVLSIEEAMAAAE